MSTGGSIFVSANDHSDVMAARATGWGMFCSNWVQEAQDLALIAQAATLDSRIPFLHFFDGFRTSHEISKIETLPDEVLRAMIDEKRVLAHRERALSPDHPVLRGTAQNPDVCFQARETVNPFYTACPDIVQRTMDRFATLTGRRYDLFEYHGAPNAERVIVLMGSSCESAHETFDYLVARDQRVGVLKVRLYRPFDARRFVQALPSTVKAIAILDRTKESGSTGEPLYLDCVHALYERLTSDWVKFQIMPKVVGGRYGLSSKEFTPAMIKAVFDNLAATSGIHRGTDALKMLMAGADATMLCSVLMRHGVDRIKTIEQEMTAWMREHEYESVEQLRGSLSHTNCPDPSAFERAHYMRAVGVRRPA